MSVRFAIPTMGRYTFIDSWCYLVTVIFALKCLLKVKKKIDTLFALREKS